MFQLKRITKEGVPAALAKAERYRLLNDPSAAESICLDILETDPENQDAAMMLLLAITDQFPAAPAQGEHRARAVLPRLRDEYSRAYYEGIIWERRAKAQLGAGTPRGGEMAYDWLTRAMECYERAERLRPPGEDKSLLRWNTCARIIMGSEGRVRARDEEAYEPSLE